MVEVHRLCGARDISARRLSRPLDHRARAFVREKLADQHVWLAAIDDMHALGRLQRPQRRLRLRDHPAGDHALIDQRPHLMVGQLREQSALRIQDARNVAQVEQLGGAQTASQIGGGVIGVDVEHGIAVPQRDGRDDRDEARRAQRRNHPGVHTS